MYATHLTVPDGYTTTVGAQTASRDYRADVTPGTYPIEYTDIRHRPVDVEKETPYYARIRVTITSPERYESTVEWGGVALASRKVEASVDEHWLSFYAYSMTGETVKYTPLLLIH